MTSLTTVTDISVGVYVCIQEPISVGVYVCSEESMTSLTRVTDISVGIYVCIQGPIPAGVYVCVQEISNITDNSDRNICRSLRMYIGTHTCRSLRIYIGVYDITYQSDYTSHTIVTMGWLRSVGSINLQVSFAEQRLFYRSLLQKRPVI